MLIYLTIFFGSLVLLAGMIIARVLYTRLHDNHIFHKVVTYRVRKFDRYLRNRFKDVKMFLRYWNKRTFSLLIHFVIEKIEFYFHKLTDFVRSKFPHHK